MSCGPVPLVDLVALHRQLADELVSVFRAALETGGFVGGPLVEGFERDFADLCNVKHCIGVSSGTDAVRLALMAAGVRPDEAVITVPNTFIATTEAISQAGAQPVFVDVDERTYNIDPEKLREYVETSCQFDDTIGKLIDRKTGRAVTAIVPVHLYGQMADMDPILQLAEQYNLIVMEDACQAHGAEYFSKKNNSWKRAGSIGRAAAFSFYPGKNLGACGEAGAVTTDDEGIAQEVRMLRDHGQAQKYYHEVEGYNGRLDAVQAGILAVKLRQLAGWNQNRREAARRYRELLCGADGVILPYEPEWSRAVYHLYVIREPDRDELREHLGGAQIGTGIHYPVPLHLQKAYRRLGYQRGDFPISERVASEIVSLPMHAHLQADQQDYVVESVADFIATRSARGHRLRTLEAAGSR